MIQSSTNAHKSSSLSGVIGFAQEEEDLARARKWKMKAVKVAITLASQLVEMKVSLRVIVLIMSGQPDFIAIHDSYKFIRRLNHF